MKSITEFLKTSSQLHTGSGFVLVILGAIAILAPFISSMTLTGLVSICAVAGGLTIATFAYRQNTWLKKIAVFVGGILFTIIGALMFYTPIISLESLTLVAIAVFIADGIMQLYLAYENRKQSWGWNVMSGICGLALAGLLVYNWPVSSLYALGTLFGVRIIFSGVQMIVAGIVSTEIIGTAEDVINEVTPQQAESVVEAQEISDFNPTPATA